MNIIYIYNGRLPTEKPHGLQTMKMCEAFAGLGHKVELWSPKRKDNTAEDPFRYYGVKKNFEIVRLNCIDFISDGFLSKPVAFWLEVVSFLLFAKIRSFFRGGWVFYSREPLAALFFKNIFLEIHTLPGKMGRLYGLILGRAKKMVVLTSITKEILIKSGLVNEDKISVAGDAFDPAESFSCPPKESCRVSLGLPENKKIILYAGSLYKWKGAETLLGASKFFGDEVVFVFVGGTGDGLENFKKLRSGTSAGNVVITGHKPHVQIPKYLKSADVLILPNSAQEKISAQYTSPMKMFEYMASGTPIVASDLPSLREVLNETNACLVEPDSAEALKVGIEKILAETDYTGSIARKALEDVRTHTWENRARKILIFLSS